VSWPEWLAVPPLAGGDAFLRGIVAGEKMFLIGDNDDLGKLAGHPPRGGA